MTKAYLLGIDVGTSGCRATAFDLCGRIMETRACQHATYYPQPGHVEQDAREWWRSVCACIRQIVSNGKVVPSNILGIGVAGQGWTCLPVDQQGRPLRPAMIWLDRRATKQAQWVKDAFGESYLVSLSGNPVDPAYVVPKILWLNQNEPSIYRQTRRFVQSNAFIVYKLTGKHSLDRSQGYGFHGFDIERGDWDHRTFQDLGLDLGTVGPLSPSNEVVGGITRKASTETGLVAGTPVVAGGLDAACACLGAGVVSEGHTQEQGGQAGGMSIVVGRPAIHPQLILGHHVVPGKWLLQGGTVGGSGTVKWFAQNFGLYSRQRGIEPGTDQFAAMSEEAGRIRPGSDGLVFLPYMAGERSPLWDPNARGVMFGLSYGKTRAHLIRSIMEGVGYSLLHNIETAEETGICVTDLTSVGGAAKSEIWTQMKSDITGRAIQVPYSDQATTLGAALLAGVATGAYASFEEAVSRTVRIQRTHVPDRGNTATYRKYFELYLELYCRLADCYCTLHRLADSPSDIV